MPLDVSKSPEGNKEREGETRQGIVSFLTRSVADVELVYLLCELVLLDGLGARNRKGKPPLKVLHLVHGAGGATTLGEEIDTRRES